MTTLAHKQAAILSIPENPANHTIRAVLACLSQASRYLRQAGAIRYRDELEIFDVLASDIRAKSQRGFTV